MITFSIIGFIQAVFFAILAISKRDKETANYVLAGLFVVLSLHLGINLIIVSLYRTKVPNLIGMSAPFYLLYGPLLYLFVKSYLSPTKFSAHDLVHAVPFLTEHIIKCLFLYFEPAEIKISMLNDYIAGKPNAIMSTSLVVHLFSPIIYALWSLKVLSLHRKNLRNLYSFTSDQLTLHWLWFLSWTMLVVGMMALSLNLVVVFFERVHWLEIRLVIMAVATLWIFLLGYYSVRKTPFYRSYPVAGVDTLAPNLTGETTQKYEKTRLKEQEIEPLKSRLLDYLKTEKPYLNKSLTIGELADEIGVPAHQLSQLTNLYLGKSFFELINSYRVEEVKNRFLDSTYSNLTLLGIAMDCGFNSKASFNRIFKQLTGQTPSEYINSKKAA